MVASTIAPVATVSPLAAKLPLHLVEQPPAQIVLLEQVAETAHRGLVRRRFATEVDPDKKAAHRPRIVKRLFDRRVRQVEPVLQQIDAQHPPDINRRRATAGLWIERLDQRAQRRPRHNPLHLTEKRRPLRRLGVTFEPHCRKGQQLHPPTHPHEASYHAHSSRLLQRFLTRSDGSRLLPLTPYLNHAGGNHEKETPHRASLLSSNDVIAIFHWRYREPASKEMGDAFGWMGAPRYGRRLTAI